MASSRDRCTAEAPAGVDPPTKRATPITPAAWAALVAIGLAAIMSQTDTSIVSIANPVIAADLDASLGQIAWVTNAYLLVLAGLLIPAGALADKIGHKKAFLIGVSGFVVASLLAGGAGAIELLISARVLAGISGALIFPSGLAMLRHAFPADRLPVAFGIFTAIAATSTAGGPILGGLLVEYASWPWAFWVNVPLGLLAVLVGVFALRETETLHGARLDLPGALVLTAAMASVVWALNAAQSHGWVSAQTLGFGFGGLALLAVFILTERTVANPTVPLGLFQNRTFGIGVVLMITTMMAFFAVLFYVTFYLQAVRGDTPAAAAVALLPLTIALTFASPLAGWLVGKTGLRALVMIGTALLAAALLLLLRLDVDSGWSVLAPALVLAGVGNGLLALCATQAIIGSAPTTNAGAASGIQQSAQSLGSTLGIAVFSSILATAAASRFGPTLLGHTSPGTEQTLHQLGANPHIADQVALGFGPGAQEALAGHLQQAGTSAGQVEQITGAVTAAAHAAFVSGLHTVFLSAACIVIAAGVLALFLREPKPADNNTEDPPPSA